MAALIRGPNGSLLRGPGGLLARGQDCCCDDCSCFPRVYVTYSISDAPFVTDSATNRQVPLFVATDLICSYADNTIVPQITIALHRDSAGNAELNYTAVARIYAALPKTLGACPDSYDSGVIDLKFGGVTKGTIRITSFPQ